MRKKDLMSVRPLVCLSVCVRPPDSEYRQRCKLQGWKISPPQGTKERSPLEDAGVVGWSSEARSSRVARVAESRAARAAHMCSSSMG